MLYIVTAIRDIDDTNNVEVAGVFDTLAKAYEARERVMEWMKNNECDNYTVFVQPTETNHLAWYEIEENI